MKRRRITLLISIWVIAAILSAGCLFAQNVKMRFPYQSEASYFGVHITDASVLDGKEKLDCDSNPGVLLNGALIPFDKNGILYLPINIDDYAEITLTGSEGYFLCGEADTMYTDVSEAVCSNHKFSVWLVGKNDYYEVSLLLTGVPMMSVETDHVEPAPDLVYEDDPDAYAFERRDTSYATAILFDPLFEKEYAIKKFNMTYQIKGAVSKAFAKKGYAVKITDSKWEEDYSLSLLGMREDNSWKLNALFTDTSLVREKTASKIWEKICENSERTDQDGPRMEYVETVFDNDYCGVYALVEPIDGEKLKLGKGDYLYKSLSNQTYSSADFLLSVQNGYKVSDTIRLKYPKKINDYSEAWKPIMEYADSIWQGGIPEEQDINSMIDIDNLVDHSIFTMLVAGCDNVVKNTYYVARINDDGKHRMSLVPWDLDYTFGNECDTSKYYGTVFNPNYEAIYMDPATWLLWEKRPDLICDRLFEKWAQLRDNCLSDTAIISMLKANDTYLINGGVKLREEERWGKAGEPRPGISEVIDYEKARLSWLDTFMYEWSLE